MLCSRCHRQVSRGAPWCTRCGLPRGAAAGGAPLLELVAPDGTGIPLVGDLTLGRAPGNDVRLEDPSVSRQHARITVEADAVALADVASSHGTFVDGERVTGARALRGGDRIELGETVLPVRVRGTGSGGWLVSGRGNGPGDAVNGHAAGGMGRAVFVPVGASLVIPAIGAPELELAAAPETVGRRPALREGCRIERVVEDGGAERWVLVPPGADGAGAGPGAGTGAMVRLTGPEGSLLGALDGRSTIAELVVEAERRLGPGGPAVLARLLGDLGERGVLEGVDGSRGARASAGVGGSAGSRGVGARVAPGVGDARPTGWRRLVEPRRWGSARLGGAFEGLYSRGGWLLFTRSALVVAGLIGFVGFAAWIALLLGRYGTPFVVASHLGLGGLVFLVSRLLLVVFHETAHGLTLASFGRRVPLAGLRLVLVFPYAFVDTSESWFEPRRRRIAVSLAGPASDLVLGGALALACRFWPAGTVRDVLFQASLAGYVGAFFNLNPFLERDGYHALVDYLERPRLRERARAALAARLSGRGVAVDPDPALRRYGLASVGWSVVAACAAIVFSLRYAPVLERYAPEALVWVVMASVWLVLLVPVALVLVPPLVARRRA